MKERSGMPYDVVAFEADEYAHALTAEEEGIFHRMMRRAWMNGSIPADLSALADLCRVDRRTLKKAWPRLSKLWVPSSEDSLRLVNKKQEHERKFLNSKRAQSKTAADVRWKLRKNKEITNASALPTQSVRNASPFPSQPIPSQPDPDPSNTTDNSSPIVGPTTEKRAGRTPDAAYEIFASKHQEFTGTAYQKKTADFVQLAALRKANQIECLVTPEKWDEAITNYFASPISVFSLSDLCVRFPVFRNSPINEFKTPINHKATGNGKQTQSERVAAAVAEQRRILYQRFPDQDPNRDRPDDGTGKDLDLRQGIKRSQ